MSKQEKTLKSKSKKCPRSGCNNNAEVSPQWGVLPCLVCQDKDNETVRLARLPEFATRSQSDRINRERDVHGADTIQPWTPQGKINREFVKQYPDKVENYFSKEQLSKL